MNKSMMMKLSKTSAKQQKQKKKREAKKKMSLLPDLSITMVIFFHLFQDEPKHMTMIKCFIHNSIQRKALYNHKSYCVSWIY